MPTYTTFTHSFYDYRDMLHEIVITKATVIDTYVIANSGELPVKLSHNGGSKNEWDATIIQGQELMFNFYVPQADVAIINTIFESGYQDFKLTYTINSTEVVFIGWIKPENMYKVFDPTPPQVEIQLSASDSLAELQSFKFFDKMNEAGFLASTTGKYKLKEILKSALLPLNLPLDIVVQLNTYEDNGMAATECILDKIYVDVELLWQSDSVDSFGLKQSHTCWDVIEMVFQDFNVKLHQTHGKYYITKFQEISSYQYTYDFATLTLSGRTAKFNTVDISGRLFRTGIEQQKVHPLSSMIVTSETKMPREDIMVNDLADWEGTWDINFDSHSIIHVNPNDPAILQVVSSSPYTASNLELLTKFYAEAVNGDEYIKILFDYRVVSYTTGDTTLPSFILKVQIQRPNGTWTAPQTSVPGLYGWWNFISVDNEITKITEAGLYNVRISFEPTNPTDWDWSTATFEIVNVNIPKISGGVNGGWSQIPETEAITRYNQANFVAGYEKLEVDTTFYDGFAPVDNGEKGSFLWYDTINAIYVPTTKKWHAYNEVDDMTITDMYMRTILLNRSKYKNFLRCTIIDREHTLNLDQVLLINGLMYTFSTFNKNFRSGEIEAELIEMVYATISGYAENVIIGLKGGSVPTADSGTNTAPLGGYFQTAHGFVVGDVISFVDDSSGGVFYLTDLLDSGDMKAIGVVTDIISADRFNYISEGYISETELAFEIGLYYYLDSLNPGKLTITPSLPTYDREYLIGMGTHRGFLLDLDYKENLGASSAKPIQVTGLILDKDLWDLPSGETFYEYDLSNANITNNSIVDVIPNKENEEIAEVARIRSRTDSVTGSVKVYSINVPTADINVTINIFEKQV